MHQTYVHMTNMMRENRSVLLIGNFLSDSAGDYRAVCEDLADHLAATGWLVHTASGRATRLGRAVEMISTAWRKRHVFRVAQIDVYSGNAFLWAEACTLLFRRLGKPYVLTLHGGNLPTFAKRWPGRISRVLHHAANVTTPSRLLADEFGTIRPDIKYLPNGMDLSAYRFTLRGKVSPQLAWLRAFHSIYNPLLAAKTLALLVDEFRKIELTMYGPDKGDGSLQTMQSWAQQTGITDRIHLPGGVPKSEVPRALAQSDIFLNTTTAESFGVSVMEAAALGMCIVSTNVGELPYLWTHEHDALLVPPNDPQAMAAAVRRILTEPDLAGHLSSNARAKAEQFDWSVILPRWEELLSEAAQQRYKALETN